MTFNLQWFSKTERWITREKTVHELRLPNHRDRKVNADSWKMFARICRAPIKISGKLGGNVRRKLGRRRKGVCPFTTAVNTFKPRTDRGNWVLSSHLEGILGEAVGKGRGKANIAVFAR